MLKQDCIMMVFQRWMGCKGWLLALALCCCVHTGLRAQEAAPAKKAVSKTLYGTASFYANKFDGRKTASGEIFRQSGLTCACNVLPMGTWVRVTNLRNGKTVVVKVNDRLHPKMRRLLDLTRNGAQKLGYVKAGLTRVKAEVLGKHYRP
jgi:rare lipoprotein A